MTRALWLGTLAVLGAFVAVPVAAAPLDWGLRVSRQESWTDHEFTYEYFGYTSHVGLLDANGWGIAGDVRPFQHFSFEGAWSQLSWNAQAFTTPPPQLPQPSIVVHGHIRMDTYALGGLYHPLPRGRFDLYLGPLIGWTNYHESVPAPAHEADFTYGAEMGIECAIGHTPLRLGLEVRRLQLAHSQVDDRDIYGSFTADTAALTIGYRFRP